MLAKAYRLQRNSDFRYVYARGHFVGSSLLSLIQVKSGPPGCLRVGFSVSKKVGGAVVRNKVKRRLRAAFRESMGRVSRGHKLIFVARPAAAQADFSKLKKEMNGLMRRAKLLGADPK